MRKNISVGLVLGASLYLVALPAAATPALDAPWIQHARDNGIVDFKYGTPTGEWVLSSGELAAWEKANGCRTCAYNIFSTVKWNNAGFSYSPLPRYLQLPPEWLAAIQDAINKTIVDTGTAPGNGTTNPETIFDDPLPPSDTTGTTLFPSGTGNGNTDGNDTGGNTGTDNTGTGNTGTGNTGTGNPGGDISFQGTANSGSPDDFPIAGGNKLVSNAVTAVPEPGMLALFGAGLIGVVGLRRRARA